MRFLKNKIIKSNHKDFQKNLSTAKAFPSPQKEVDLPIKKGSISKKSISKSKSLLSQRHRNKGHFVTPYTVRSTKNIVKNYGRAMCTFAASTLAKPYLNDALARDDYGITIEQFYSFIQANKEVMDSIERFKNMIISCKEDGPVLDACKRLFKYIAEIFIKYFSVNWIFSGKLMHKQPHLEFRFKLLRRIRNPELFTYLKPFSKK